MARDENISIERIADDLKSGRISPGDLVNHAVKQVNACEKDLHALNRNTLDQAGTRAKGWKYSEDSPYSGIPYIQKDNLCTKGVVTDCSSRILRGFVPPYSSKVDERLSQAGFVLAGKSNMDEFSMGSSTEYSAWGPTKNPHDLSRVPGGSSGGSAAAVAAGYVPLAFGSDTGGSIRQPAAFCGLVGLRPTYGRVSRWGLISYASSLDQVGPITRTVRDSAIALSIIQGKDKYDSTVVPINGENYLDRIENGISDLRIGILDVSYADWVDSRIKEVFEKNVEWFRKNARGVEMVSIKSFDLILASYYILAPSEASSNLARYDGIRFGPSVDIANKDEFGDEDTADGLLDFYRKNRGRGFGEEVTRRILIGTFALSSGYYDEYYGRAHKVRTKVRMEIDALLDKVDLIISPTTPTPPFRLGECLGEPMDMYRADMLTLFQPIAGCPAITLNGGWVEKDETGAPLKKSRQKNYQDKPVTRLPVGLQITAAPFREETLFRAARAFERDM